MRKDMKHVIIDRPRRGGDGGKSKPVKGTKKEFQKTPWEDKPNRESTARGRLYGWDCKQLNEHLSPLYRWLGSQVGRSWDEVWSEICDGLSVRNATTAHVRDHADQAVEKNCTFVNGVLCDSKGLPLGTGWRHHDYYVDPNDNTLQRLPTSPRWRYQPSPKKWVDGEDEDHRYYLLKGIWHEVELKPLPKPRRSVWEDRVYDLVMAAHWDRTDKKYVSSDFHQCERYHHRKVYAKNKRQLNKAEIRRLKLWETDIGKAYRGQM